MEWEQWYVDNTITDMFHVNIKVNYQTYLFFGELLCLWLSLSYKHNRYIKNTNSRGAIGMQTFKYVSNNYNCDD